MIKTYEYESSCGTDIVEFFENGALYSWKIWSEAMDDYIDINIDTLRKQWPSKVFAIEQKCIDLAHEIVQNRD